LEASIGEELAHFAADGQHFWQHFWQHFQRQHRSCGYTALAEALQPSHILKKECILEQLPQAQVNQVYNHGACMFYTLKDPVDLENPHALNHRVCAAQHE
jgi:hypothetical protein